MDEIIDYVMETPGNTNPNVLRGMLNNSGGNLPAITSDDNGDVLTVVDGKWAKAAPSGGGGILVATDTNGTLDKTWQEIRDADYAIVVQDFENSGEVYHLTAPLFQTIIIDDEDYVISVYVGGDTVYYSTDSADGYPVREEGQ